MVVPKVLSIEERADPTPQSGHVLIEVKAFGINQAEVYFRKGVWGDVAEISGIECVGLFRSDPDGQFTSGQKVMALVGGMGRSLNGSYVELTSVPRTNVVAIDTDLAWEELAAIPESYATAWTSLVGILDLTKGQTILVRGASSALGQAALNIARHAGAHIIATTRNASRTPLLKTMGADEILLEFAELSMEVRHQFPGGSGRSARHRGRDNRSGFARVTAPRRPSLLGRLSRRRGPADTRAGVPNAERCSSQRLCQRPGHGNAVLSSLGNSLSNDSRPSGGRDIPG